MATLPGVIASLSRCWRSRMSANDSVVMSWPAEMIPEATLFSSAAFRSLGFPTQPNSLGFSFSFLPTAPVHRIVDPSNTMLSRSAVLASIRGRASLPARPAVMVSVARYTPTSAMLARMSSSTPVRYWYMAKPEIAASATAMMRTSVRRPISVDPPHAVMRLHFARGIGSPREPGQGSHTGWRRVKDRKSTSGRCRVL